MSARQDGEPEEEEEEPEESGGDGFVVRDAYFSEDEGPRSGCLGLDDLAADLHLDAAPGAPRPRAQERQGRLRGSPRPIPPGMHVRSSAALEAWYQQDGLPQLPATSTPGWDKAVVRRPHPSTACWWRAAVTARAAGTRPPALRGGGAPA